MRSIESLRPGKGTLKVIVGIGSTLMTVGALATPASAATTPKATSSCPAVYVLFARGTSETGTLGTIVGPDFTSAVESNLPGKSVSIWGDPYAASADQSSAGPGATDMTDELESDASACPSAKFVLGGYSQGASVVDIALGIKTELGSGTSIPVADQPKLAGILTWGNPLRLFGGETIAKEEPALASRTLEYCNTGDPVCGNGFNIAAHLEYGSNGDATAGGVFAAKQYLAGN
jgi:cutinase